MKHKITLGDFFTEAQLRTLVRDYQVEQRFGTDSIRGSRSPKRRQSELSGVDAVRYRVQRKRHYRQEGKLPRRRYVSCDDAITRYERAGERLESGEEMFRIGQGERMRKKADIRANAIKGGRGGKVVHRPVIDEGKGRTIRKEKRAVKSAPIGLMGKLV